MKKIITILLMLILSIETNGQSNFYYLNFEDTTELKHVFIDTFSNKRNTWQVGIPKKLNFNKSISTPNAIVTDLNKPYKTNDTSSFLITNTANGLGWIAPQFAFFSGSYQANTDSLKDFGKIEISLNKGLTWIDLVNDTIYTKYYNWMSPKPILTGNSNGWKSFQVNMAQLGPVFKINRFDTILYRLTFISDSSQSNKDGLMFDDLFFADFVDGPVNQMVNNDLLSIWPNPANNELCFKFTNLDNNPTIRIYSSLGQLIFERLQFDESSIDLKDFSAGIYFIQFSLNKNSFFKKIQVIH